MVVGRVIQDLVPICTFSQVAEGRGAGGRGEKLTAITKATPTTGFGITPNFVPIDTL